MFLRQLLIWAPDSAVGGGAGCPVQPTPCSWFGSYLGHPSLFPHLGSVIRCQTCPGLMKHWHLVVSGIDETLALGCRLATAIHCNDYIRIQFLSTISSRSGMWGAFQKLTTAFTLLSDLLWEGITNWRDPNHRKSQEGANFRNVDATLFLQQLYTMSRQSA